MNVQKFDFCPRCGEKLYGKFCVRCGFDTEKEIVAENAAENADEFEFTADSETDIAVSTELGVRSDRFADAKFIAEAEKETDAELDVTKYGSEPGRQSELDSEFGASDLGVFAEFDTEMKSEPVTVTRERNDGAENPNENASSAFECAMEKIPPNGKTADLSESRYEKKLKKLTVCVQYLCIFFACASLLLMLCPYQKFSDGSGTSIYGIMFFTKYPMLMLLSNTALIFASFHLTRNRRFTSVVLCVLQMLSLIPIGLMISESKDVEFSSGVYAYLVLAVLGLALFLAYAVSVFVWERKILSERHCAEPIAEQSAAQIARIATRRQTKRMTKTKKILLSVTAGVALIAVVGVSIFCGVYFSSIFRAGKVNQIEIGFYSAKVEQILGKPNYSSGVDEWVYYDDDYRDITQKINGPISSGDYKLLSTQRSAMFYRRISIKFSNKTVTSIEYDAKHVDANAHLYQYKPYKKIVLDPSEISYGRPVSVSASVYYDDGSFRKYALPKDALKNVDSFIKGRYIVSWSDNWNDYSATLEVK